MLLIVHVKCDLHEQKLDVSVVSAASVDTRCAIVWENLSKKAVPSRQEPERTPDRFTGGLLGI